MLEIKNGVIKNIDKLSPESQRYLNKLKKDLALNEPNQFNIGFLYRYEADGNKTWEDSKHKFEHIKHNVRTKFLDKLSESERQESKISAIVSLIQSNILDKIKTNETKYLNSWQSAFNRRRGLANFIKKLTIGIFGSTLFALATTALITQGYISLPVIMPIIMPAVTLVIANPIIASAALITIMTMLFLASWKAVSSKRNAEHALAKAKTQTEGNIESLDNAKDQDITPTKSPSFSGTIPLQAATATTAPRYTKPSPGQDVVGETGNLHPRSMNP